MQIELRLLGADAGACASPSPPARRHVARRPGGKIRRPRDGGSGAIAKRGTGCGCVGTGATTLGREEERMSDGVAQEFIARCGRGDLARGAG